jgi:catechol 2,3-dioxygenase-like lactoylglutathione lyase family enzyme
MKYTTNDDVAIGVESLKKSIAFYEGTLGFKPIKSEPGLRVYNTGHFTLYIEEGEPHPPVPSFTVENLSQAKEHLLENGCTVIVERENSLYFRDPDGNIWDIIES